uniref:Uncharacterized protein n=1 Tax=Arundo donax TaxID=35708 RepID=A0A0A8YXG4_ARUDO
MFIVGIDGEYTADFYFSIKRCAYVSPFCSNKL